MTIVGNSRKGNSKAKWQQATESTFQLECSPAGIAKRFFLVHTTTENKIQRIKARRLQVPSTYPSLHIFWYHITSPQTMRFSLVLIVVTALIATVYASDAEVEGCPLLCKHDSDCSACKTQKCVSSCILDITTRLTGIILGPLCMCQELSRSWAMWRAIRIKS